MSQATRIVALAGRPNTGKTSLFNALTGRHQRIANFAGTTVEKASGELSGDGKTVQIIDLPGIATPMPSTEDQRVSLDFLDETLAKAPDFAVFWVIEASHLEHDLGLALLYHRLGYPVVLVLNMIDEARENGLNLDIRAFSEAAQMPVITTSARTQEGLDQLREMILTWRDQRAMAKTVLGHLPPLALFSAHQEAVDAARELAKSVVRGSKLGRVLPKIAQAMRWDRFFLHPIFGPLFFLFVMVFLFHSIFSWAAPLSDFISILFDRLGQQIGALSLAPGLRGFIVDGALSGISAVMVFIPQLAILFFLIGILEKSGYLPRAAALMDRIMRPLGLDGKVFVPLLSSFACAIPGIMATRTIESEKRRIATILIAPLMTCSARLPVYTLIIAAFVPASWRILGLQGQAVVMTVMYVAGVLFAVLAALIIKTTGLYECNVSYTAVLPPFRLPHLRELIAYTAQRCMLFVMRAGKVIFMVSVVLWFLAMYPRAQVPAGMTADSSVFAAFQMGESYLGQLGRWIEPLFDPLGYDWKLSVAILSAFAAREVFVGTLGTIYALGTVDEHSLSLIEHLRQATAPDGTPLYTAATAVSLLIFFAIALQCVSTVAVTYRETGGIKWPIIQLVYLWVSAYLLAAIGYRLALYFI